MADVKYPYSISEDFTGLVSPYTSPDCDSLTQAIRDSAITIALDFIGIAGDLCDIWFKAELSEGDETILEGIVAAHTGKPLEEATPHIGEFGEMLVSNRPLPSTQEFYEQNKHMVTLTDKTTWFELAEEVINEILSTTDPNYKVYDSDHTHWIDLFHHRVMDEENLPLIAQYQVEVKVDDEPMLQCHNIWDASAKQLDDSLIPSDEFFVYYDTGKIIFGSSQEGNTVKASYYYATTFRYIMRPSPGKVLEVRNAEVQGSLDLVYTCSIAFQLWGYNPYAGFNPAYGKVPWQVPMILGSQWNFLSEGKGNYPSAIAIGGDYHYGQVSRGMVKGGIIMPFPYNTSKILKSSLGMEMRVFFLEGEGPWLGEFGNATFYCFEYEDADYIEP